MQSVHRVSMFPSTISIADREIGPGLPTFVVAEIGQAHDGSLGTAHAYIDLVARCGAHAVKFQTHIAEAESTPGEPFRVKFSRQDPDRYAYWKRMEFTEAQWRGLADHCRDVGLVFLSTPFSFEAVDLLERLDMAAWKVGSGEVNNLPMLERMAKTGRPVLLSSGLSSWADLDQAMRVVRDAGGVAAVLQCTTAYPCPPDRVGLNVLDELRRRYACPVGLSDHSGAEYAGLAATALGADLLEVHVVFSRDCFGPDVGASLTPEQLRRLVDGAAFIRRAADHPVDKDAEAGAAVELRTMFGKSVVAARDLPVGHRLVDADLRLKKPGDGIPAARLREVVGRTLARAVPADRALSEQDLA
jgi:N-acetylneuraminate synthase